MFLKTRKTIILLILSAILAFSAFNILFAEEDVEALPPETYAAAPCPQKCVKLYLFTCQGHHGRTRIFYGILRCFAGLRT